MDVSYSMDSMFRDGTVQRIIERVMGLGLNFDDNGAIDIFAFQSSAYDLGELTPQKFKNAAQWILARVSMGGTNYAPAIRQVVEHYGYGQSKRGLLGSVFGSGRGALPAKYPTYVLFVTDGACGDESEARTAIREASHFPIFFQFVGIGSSSFGFLEELDDLDGRLIDNANFFSVRDPNVVTEDQLYSKMMAEYPGWLNLAKGQNLIR